MRTPTVMRRARNLEDHQSIEASACTGPAWTHRA